MNIDAAVSALVTLLVTIDPIGLAPVFLLCTQGMTARERRGVAVRAALIALAVLTFFLLAGRPLLSWLGIGLPAFRIAGGLLLFWIAFEMVFERRTDRKQQTAAAAMTTSHIRNIAIFPLAIPMMAGPGAITAVMLLSARVDGALPGLIALIALLGLTAAICLLIFLAAGTISNLLGFTGSSVLSRLLGVVLTALAVQFVIDGVSALAGRAGAN